MVYYVLMGLFDRFTTRQNQPDTQIDVSASLAPYNSQQLVGGILFGTARDNSRDGIPLKKIVQAFAFFKFKEILGCFET